jgi:hypothetical protein
MVEVLEGGGCCSIYSVPVIFISLTTNLIQIFRSDRSINVFNLVPMLFPPQEGRAWERGCLIPTACLFAGLGWTVYMLWERDWNVLRAIKKIDHYIESCNIYRTKTSLLTYLKIYLTTLAIHNIFVKIQCVDFQMGRVILTNYLNSHLNLRYSGHTAFKLVKRGCIFRLRRKTIPQHCTTILKTSFKIVCFRFWKC